MCLSTPLAYLRPAVANRVRDRHRRRLVELRHAQAGRTPPSSPQRTPSHLQLSRKLPVRERQVLVLRYHHNLALAQISDVLGYPLGTVKSLAHRGMLLTSAGDALGGYFGSGTILGRTTDAGRDRVVA